MYDNIKMGRVRPASLPTIMSDQTLLDVSDISKEVTHCCDLAPQKEGSQTLHTVHLKHIYYN